jgi:hypothetical protein
MWVGPLRPALGVKQCEAKLHSKNGGQAPDPHSQVRSLDRNSGCFVERAMQRKSTLARRSFLKSAIVAAATACALPALADTGWGIRDVPYEDVIQQVVAMPMDGDLQSRAARHGLNVVNVMWEDTGRSAGSSIGPNISDLTLQVRRNVQGGVRGDVLPVLRYPNFTDKTADVKLDKLWVRVGNQHAGSQTVTVPLSEVLENMREYLSDPDTLKGKGNFLAQRDSHALVSAQHVFVPIPKGGKAEFNPVLFNYQSAPGSPAVLTLLVTREGTSATIVENNPDPIMPGWGQQLYFNNKGQRTVFTAERKSDVKKRIESGHAKASDAGALDEGADMLLLVQVPLVHKNVGYLGGFDGDDGYAEAEEMAPAADAPVEGGPRMLGRRSNVEQAVIGHGDDMGPFNEMGGLQLVRDDRFPIRVTVQFYKATSNGVVSDQDLASAAAQIDKVYASGDFVGSLVVPEGKRDRPTDWLKGRTRFDGAVSHRSPDDGKKRAPRSFFEWLTGG